MKRSFANGFTLIETIVVVAVIGLTLPVLFAIIFTLMRQQIKIYRLSQIKRGGDYLINIMENTIKDKAITIYKSAVLDDSNIVCKDALSSYSSTSNLYFLDKNEQLFGYKLNINKVASASANPDVDLISGKIIVSGFSIGCSRNTIYSPPSVLLDFDVCFNTGAGVCTSTRPEEITSMHYQTRIKLRNY